MKILLTTLNAKYIHLNLAIRLLYQMNKEHEGIEWKEFTIKENKDDIANYSKDFEVVAFSCYIWNITQILEVARKIKIQNPNTKVLLGGPEVSYEWQKIITLPEVDYIIIGEGEIPFQEFINNYPKIENICNLVIKKNENILYTEKSMMFDLKKFEHLNPYIDDVPSELFNKVCYIETSRGCPYKCEFCLASLDNKVRYLPDVAIKANLLYLMNNGRAIKFLDRTFNIKKDFTIDIFKFILEHHHKENVFQFEITADIVHPDIIKFIDEHVPKGLFRFEIGIQTVNQKANLQVNRKQNFEKTKSIIQQLQHKVEMHLDLIVGLPLDYWEDIKYSIEEVFKLFAPELQLGFLKFLKGTPMRTHHKEDGYVYDPSPPYQMIESKYLSKEELQQIVILENALEIYWNGKKAVKTLKYVTANYSVFDFLLGLGKYFGSKKDFHKFSLNDVYEIISEYCKQNYGDNKILQEFISIDYYLYHKVKPQILFLNEIDRTEKKSIIQELQLNHHKYRYIVLPISFDYETFITKNEIVLLKSKLIIQYNGREKAEVVYANHLIEQN